MSWFCCLQVQLTLQLEGRHFRDPIRRRLRAKGFEIAYPRVVEQLRGFEGSVAGRGKSRDRIECLAVFNGFQAACLSQSKVSKSVSFASPRLYPPVR